MLPVKCCEEGSEWPHCLACALRNLLEQGVPCLLLWVLKLAESPSGLQAMVNHKENNLSMKELSSGPLCTGGSENPGPIWWKPWACTNHQRRGTSLQLVTAMAKKASETFMPTSAFSWMHDEKCGIPTDSQVFQFQALVISEVFSFLLFNTKNCIIVNGDPPNSHGENGPK